MVEITYTSKQVGTILDLCVNLHWDLVREMLNVWTNLEYNEEVFDDDKIKRAKQLTDDFQELESTIKGVPIV